MIPRACGILLPVTSLPSRFGTGCFDRAAYEFIDWLAEAGQHVWQILPIGPTGYGDSPYQAFSTFAGNPYFISLEELIDAGWLTEQECMDALPDTDPRHVDYEVQYVQRMALLRKAFERSDLCLTEKFRVFCKENADWLDDYALFMAIKNARFGQDWTAWEHELAMREPAAITAARKQYAEDIRFYEFLQCLFFDQLQRLLAYAHSKEIYLIGDIPIYVAPDSADAWADPQLFQLDENHKPTDISGCPPDAFAVDGQLWGNPLYRWEVHEATDFAWWIRRIRHCFKTCDILRIDHFRGFDEYYSIPAGSETAAAGHWEKGPGMKLFIALREALGDAEIIAEDLGYVTDSVRQLVADSGYAGMKVLEFAFDSRDTGSAKDYLPHNYPVNAVAYTGTHDNVPLEGWLREISDEEKDMARRYICSDAADEQLYWPLACAVLRSPARIAVIPLQDYLGYGNEARINQPSTMGKNWRWRVLPGECTPELASKLRSAAILYGRKEEA